MKWKLHQLYVKISFLNGFIEEVCIEQPPRFENHNKETHVCRLKKYLYGLKQAPRAWNGRIDGFLMSLGFTKSKANYNLYYTFFNEGIMILFLYVNELFLIGEENTIDE